MTVTPRQLGSTCTEISRQSELRSLSLLQTSWSLGPCHWPHPSHSPAHFCEALPALWHDSSLVICIRCPTHQTWGGTELSGTASDTYVSSILICWAYQIRKGMSDLGPPRAPGGPSLSPDEEGLDWTVSVMLSIPCLPTLASFLQEAALEFRPGKTPLCSSRRALFSFLCLIHRKFSVFVGKKLRTPFCS